MRSRFLCTEFGLYCLLTPKEERELLVTAARSYKIEQHDGSKRRVHGVKRELNPNAGIDLLIEAEALADEYDMPVHFQTADGFTVDLILPSVPNPIRAARSKRFAKLGIDLTLPKDMPVTPEWDEGVMAALCSDE